jgi:hypothetical protein
MEMGAFTGALVALLAKDMASAIASEIGRPPARCASTLYSGRHQRSRGPDGDAGLEGGQSNRSPFASLRDSVALVTR